MFRRDYEAFWQHVEKDISGVAPAGGETTLRRCKGPEVGVSPPLPLLFPFSEM